MPLTRADRARQRELAEWPGDNRYVTHFWARAWHRAATMRVQVSHSKASKATVIAPAAIYLDGAEWRPSNVDPLATTRVLTDPNWRLSA